jgi:hypothetical protein
MYINAQSGKTCSFNNHFTTCLVSHKEGGGFSSCDENKQTKHTHTQCISNVCDRLTWWRLGSERLWLVLPHPPSSHFQQPQYLQTYLHQSVRPNSANTHHLPTIVYWYSRRRSMLTFPLLLFISSFSFFFFLIFHFLFVNQHQSIYIFAHKYGRRHSLSHLPSWSMQWWRRHQGRRSQELITSHQRIEEATLAYYWTAPVQDFKKKIGYSQFTDFKNKMMWCFEEKRKKEKTQTHTEYKTCITVWKWNKTWSNRQQLIQAAQIGDQAKSDRPPQRILYQR